MHTNLRPASRSRFIVITILAVAGLEGCSTATRLFRIRGSGGGATCQSGAVVTVPKTPDRNTALGASGSTSACSSSSKGLSIQLGKAI